MSGGLAMTKEMLRLVLLAALQDLSRCSDAQLAARIPWLTHQHLAWCLVYYRELTLSPEDIEALAHTRKILAALDVGSAP